MPPEWEATPPCYDIAYASAYDSSYGGHHLLRRDSCLDTRDTTYYINTTYDDGDSCYDTSGTHLEGLLGLRREHLLHRQRGRT